MIKLGYKASAEQFDPRELVELAVAAEAHGMESVTVSEQVSRALQVTGRAVEQAVATSGVVAGPASAAQRIGEVVEMINTIAGQTATRRPN